MFTSELTLYDRIGGESALVLLLDRFYERVLSDVELAPFFKNSSMEGLRRMQHEYFSAALDGPHEYTGMSLLKAHAGRGIRPRHFNLFAQHLLETLQDMGLSDRDVQDVVSRIARYADDITGSTTFPG